METTVAGLLFLHGSATFQPQTHSPVWSPAMSKSDSPAPRPRISLDVYAVALALLLALLVRLNLIPPVKW